MKRVPVIVLITAAGVAATVGVAHAVTSHGSSRDTATVERVVDGDTIDVRLRGETERVRLLNIDTPETVDPEKPVECLGPEASAYVKRLLPSGTKVSLAYDRDRTDTYGRTLAGVYVGDDLVNAKIARAGLADAIVVGSNDRFYPQVEAARAAAQRAQVGLFSPGVACAVAARVQDAEGRADELAATGRATDTDDAAQLASAVALATTLDTDAAEGGLGWRIYDDATRRALVARAGDARHRLEAAQVAVRQHAAQERVRQAAEKKAAAAKKAAEKLAAAKKAAAAKKVAEKRAAANEAAAQRAASSAGTPATTEPREPSPAPSITATVPRVPHDTYTGCRAYSPHGTSLDDKGRPYTKIDCTTKLPLG